MFFRGMSNWNLAELEDIDWDVFGKCDDHIVPRQGGELLDESSGRSAAHKKARHDVKNEVDKDLCGRGSAATTVLWGKEDAYSPTKNGSTSTLEGSLSYTSSTTVPTFCDVESTAKGTLPYEDDRILDYYVKASNYDAQKNLFCLNDPSLGATGSINDESCLSSLNGVSPDVTDRSFLENKQKGRDADLACNDWPDLGNLEDFDKMFRNWDSTFGQGQTGTVDELSWFSSSSNINYGSEIAFESGFQSSSSDFGAQHANLESHCPNAKVLQKRVPATSDQPTSPNYADWLGTDAPSKGKSVGKESCDGGNEIKIPGLTQMSNECSLNQSGASDVMIKRQTSSEDKETTRTSDELLLGSTVLPPPIYSPRQILQQNHFTGCSSASYMPKLCHQSQMDYGLLVHQVPFTQITANVPPSSYKAPDQLYMPQAITSEKNMEKLYQREQACSSIATEHPYQQQPPVFENIATIQKKELRNREVTKTDDVEFGLPTIEMDHPITQESSGTTPVSSCDISEKVTSFQKLQDVMHQLDVRTKLCLRDSLYRLARSARQRHGFTTQNFNEGPTDAEGFQATDVSNRSVDFMDAERNTNPIDRSIAHLLFHKPSDFVTGVADGIMHSSVVS